MRNLFDKINEAEREKLLRYLEADVLRLKKNANLFSYVKEKRIIGVVESGCIQVSRNNPNGSRTIIEELHEKELFGSLISMILSDEYEFIALEDTEVIIIEYNRIIERRPDQGEVYTQFLRNLLNLISDKVQERNERVEILTKKTIRDKLLEYFRINSVKTHTKVIYLPFNFTELADYLGVDRSAMSRELRYLKEEGFIQVKGKKITLLY